MNLLLCQNTIPDVELTDGSHKGLNRVEALAPLVLVLTQNQCPTTYKTQSKTELNLVAQRKLWFRTIVLCL